MKATGIVRRIDDLGRVVIPKEIRKTLRLNAGDPIEIFTDRDELIFKKYSPIKNLEVFAESAVQSMHAILGNVCLICDTDCFLAAKGCGKIIGEKISSKLEKALRSKMPVVLNLCDGAELIQLTSDDTENSFSAQIIVPIVSEGDVIGGCILATRTEDNKIRETDLKVVQTCAEIISRGICE